MIICEIGMNHLGCEDYANEYIDAIAKTQADAITFQIREGEFYKGEARGRLKLNHAEYYAEAAQRVRNSGKQFGVALADAGLVEFFEGIGVDFYKVLSKDIGNFHLIDALVNGSAKPIFASTGMSDFAEIDEMVQHADAAGERLRLIHTQLTHEIKDVNLTAILLLRERFGLDVAFGNHCSNLNVLHLALAFGPSDIFFYVKGDRTPSHPDEAHAVALNQVEQTVDNLLQLQEAIGTGVKLRMDNAIDERKESRRRCTE